MVSQRYFGWMMTGLATLGAVAGGVLLGAQASAEMDPFYANVAAQMPDDRTASGVEIVDGQGSGRWVTTTPDFGYADAQRRATERDAY